MYWCTAYLHDLDIQVFLSLSIFGATLFIYNYHRLFRKKVIYAKEISERHQWILAHDRLLQVFAVAGFLLAAGCFIPYLNPTLFFRLSPFLLLSLFYVIPVWKGKKKWLRVRDIPFMKIFLVAAVWSFVTVFLAFLAEDPFWFPDIDAWLTTLQRFIFIFAITLPFDIRDLAHDRSSGLTTFAARLGVEGVKRLANILLVVVAALAGISTFIGIYSLPHGIGVSISCALTGFLISRIDEDSSEWIYAGFLDGTMLDQFLWISLLAYFF
ncbi:MAG: UbiA family prenyltransferase [Bacteroidia bacterium]